MNKRYLGLLVAVVTFTTTTAFADPPPWAPAWGYRAKHEDHHHGHEDDYDDDYNRNYRYYDENHDSINNSILSGSCNRELIGSMIGGAAGGYIGSNIGKGDGNLAATAVGALLGYMIGKNVGRNMDQLDVRCTGYALEVAPDNRQVEWTNPDTNARYTVTPKRTYRNEDRYCREYTTDTTIAGRTEEVYGTACRNTDGSWQIVN